MFGLDDRIAELGAGHGLLVALAVAVVLGLRHATDPDHLAAVSTLVLGDGERDARRASVLGLAWGLGHAVTLIALGLPVLLASRALPNGLHQAAEIAVGVIIIGLAVRVLARWRRGSARVGRTPRAAFGIGLVHGVGGSAGVGVIVISAISSDVEAIAALVLFTLASAVSMALVSGAFGRGLTARPARRRFAALAPALATVAMLFGTWYILGATGTLPYVF